VEEVIVECSLLDHVSVVVDCNFLNRVSIVVENSATQFHLHRWMICGGVGGGGCCCCWCCECCIVEKMNNFRYILVVQRFVDFVRFGNDEVSEKPRTVDAIAQNMVFRIHRILWGLHESRIVDGHPNCDGDIDEALADCDGAKHADGFGNCAM
jgi:hypothetical protein